jgi:hypothetical protein
MKKILIPAISFWLMLSSGFSQQYQKLEKDEVSPTDIRLATSLAEKLLIGQKTGNIYFPTDKEATQAVVDGLTEEMQASTYATIRDMFGDYESMKFAEAWEITGEPMYLLFRFKGTFSESSKQPEIRVVLDMDRKLAGFFIRPWQDDLTGQP